MNKATNKLPTQLKLKELFDYNEHTGVLTNKKTGYIVGSKANPRDYYYVRISQSLFTIQRVIWKWMTGEEPGEVVDHKNEDKLDNRWSNLQSITHTENIKRSNKPHKVSAIDINLIFILRQMGHSFEQIANILGYIAPTTVFYHFNKAAI